MSARRRPIRNDVVAPLRAVPRESGDFPVVGIGASAGGLDAFQKFFDAQPPDSGIAFILIQHLDPTHASMMVELLSKHTTMHVQQATDGMVVQRNGVYAIAPGTYLAMRNGALRITEPRERHGARLPFDFLLHSLAEELGARAIGVILSGTGADGSIGLKAVKGSGGLVIAQDPDEAGFDGMPRSAISAGVVDRVLPVAKIPRALADHLSNTCPPADEAPLPKVLAPDPFAAIIDLLRTGTAHDFTQYKQGTLKRRIERRMSLVAIESDDMGRYLELLRNDAKELGLLANDLLINVTRFFRDPKVFDLLAETVIPELLRDRAPDQPLRIWIAGCSTGEETYSLAMIIREQITAAKLDIKLQVFASDVDPDAIARARESAYPKAIEADVSPARLARFFTWDGHSYKVLPALRAAVVFTVQDVLADPPFSRLDLVSCRNLLIYLGSKAQAKVVSIFHFALRQGGFLLLGSSETAGDVDERFELIEKTARLYRHISRSRPGELALARGSGDGARVLTRQERGQAPARKVALAELCRRMIIDSYAPAAVLINHRDECLYSLGPIDRYLRVALGHATQDLFALTHDSERTKLRAAIHQARQKNARIAIAGGRVDIDGTAVAYSIAVQPVMSDAEQLLLICFIDEPPPAPKRSQKRGHPAPPRDRSRIAELEKELEATRSELQSAVRNLEVANDGHNEINEEALSVNEEFQSTNEELLTSKEELQSLNEELTALNTQLQETLERQRTTSNDLQNVLYSTDVATIFLDTKLEIRFFTPASQALFHVIPSDVGRPLADLSSLAADALLLTDARTVMQTLLPLEREIESGGGIWFYRRVLPYLTQEKNAEGVVITFTDITARKHITRALEEAKRQAEHANAAKSRFLAAASHDLRQPLQTLALLQGLLAKIVDGERAQKLVAMLNQALAAMSGMLNTLLDINQIETGIVHAHATDFPINELLDRLRDEFTYHAQAQGLALRVVRCGMSVRSDPLLLEQMIRNLLSNAMKYTQHGKVLMGCRRRGGQLYVEIWDTGVGIPDSQLQSIFEEYHQVDNAARERSRGLGLGLSIVDRLGRLLNHRVSVRSKLGKGSVFAIEVALPATDTALASRRPGTETKPAARADQGRAGMVLIVEDDPEVRELLELTLKDAGHRATAVPDGHAAVEIVSRGALRPDLVLADYNLPNGMNGLEVTAKLREVVHHRLPSIILTGDISTATLRDIARQDCILLHKPVKMTELTQIIQTLLSSPPSATQPATMPAAPASATAGPAVIFVVDDDSLVREAMRATLEHDGRSVETYATCEAFLAAYRPGREACLLIDTYLPGMSGLELLQRLNEAGHRLPAIMITGKSDVPTAVQAMKAGASNFIEKPVGRAELLDSVARALEQSRDTAKLFAWRQDAAQRIAKLTPRQRRIMDLILAGIPSKNIAADLGISQRTVEHHRAAIMTRTGAPSLPALARLALAAAENGSDALRR